jgi:flavin-dependent dehydrogenase
MHYLGSALRYQYGQGRNGIVKKRIVVIGGSAAGPKAAARAKRMDPGAEVTIIQKGPEMSMASCGYPYFVGGVFNNRNALLSTPYGEVRDPHFFLNTKGIRARTETEFMAIDLHQNC